MSRVRRWRWGSGIAALLAFLLSARTRTHLAQGKTRWGIAYSVLALVFILWLVRIAHLIGFGPDH